MRLRKNAVTVGTQRRAAHARSVPIRWKQKSLEISRGGEPHSSVISEDISPISGAGGDRPPCVYCIRPHVEFSILFS